MKQLAMNRGLSRPMLYLVISAIGAPLSYLAGRQAGVIHFDDVALVLITFEMLALTRGETFAFRAETKSLTDREVVFEISPRSWFINLLVEPIVLTYDRKKRRLIEYQGLTNIEASKNGHLLDEHYHARIEYVFEE